jgi:hypothetical protein
MIRLKLRYEHASARHLPFIDWFAMTVTVRCGCLYTHNSKSYLVYDKGNVYWFNCYDSAYRAFNYIVNC